MCSEEINMNEPKAYVKHRAELDWLFRKIFKPTVIGAENIPAEDEKFLYLLHGLSDDESKWSRYTSIERYAAEYNFFVIMPDGSRSFYTDAENGANYWSFISGELPQKIKTLFNRDCPRERTFAAGLSMGGGGSTSYAQRHADMFCACYAMSALMHYPAPNPSAEKNKMWHMLTAANKYSCVDYVKNADEKTNEALKTVAWYIDCGDDDFLFEYNIDLVLAMRKAGIPHQLRVRDGAHTWEYWHSALYEALPFVSRIFGK